MMGDSGALDGRFETIMSDIECLENRINDFKQESAIDAELELIDDLFLIFRGMHISFQTPCQRHRLSSTLAKCRNSTPNSRAS